jgi:hypothetical protein
MAMKPPTAVIPRRHLHLAQRHHWRLSVPFIIEPCRRHEPMSLELAEHASAPSG